MSFTQNEYGATKILRVAGLFDMSSYTELTLVLYLPSDYSVGASATITKTTADGVTIGAGVTDPTLGVLAANEYVDYAIEQGVLTDAGTWKAVLIYDNSATSPPDHLIGGCAEFTVTATCAQ